MNQHIEKIVREYATAWSSGDVERVAAFFTDNCEFEDVPLKMTMHGKDELRYFIAATFGAIPDFKVDIQWIAVMGNNVAFEWIQSGTQSGGFGPLPPGGGYYQVKAASVLELDHDLIRRAADYWDLATSLKQMGHLDVELIP